MLFFLVLGILMLLPGLFFTVLAIHSLNPNNLITITGELTKKRNFKNYKLKSRSVPNAVAYTYTYIVNGKPYSLRGVQLTHSRNLYKRIAIVYLRAFPRCAYTEHFSGIQEWLIAISFLQWVHFYFCFIFVLAKQFDKFQFVESFVHSKAFSLRGSLGRTKANRKAKLPEAVWLFCYPVLRIGFYLERFSPPKERGSSSARVQVRYSDPFHRWISNSSAQNSRMT